MLILAHWKIDENLLNVIRDRAPLALTPQNRVAPRDNEQR